MIIERGGKPARESRLGPASRAFLQMSSGEAALEGEETSRARKLAALGLAVLMLCAAPLLWAALGPGSDQAAAVVASKSHDQNSGPGSGDDDDNSGPGDGDDPTDTDLSRATTRKGTTRGTTTGTGRGDTRASTRAGTTRTNTATTRGTRVTTATSTVGATTTAGTTTA